MKKTIRFFALTAAVAFCFITAAHAADSYFELDGFAFDISDEGKATVRSYSGSDTDVVIPDKLLRAPVVGIGDYAFYQNKTIASVSFDQAAQLNSIGVCAFYGCSSLKELELPAQAALSFGAFQNCTGLERLCFADGTAAIPDQCFYGCSSLTEITLPDTVTEIGERAFGECEELRYVYVSDTVGAIADNAFEGDRSVIVRCERDSAAAQFAQKNGVAYECPATYLCGDADGDGQITVVDATVIQRLLARLTDDPDGLITLRGCVCDDTIGIDDVTAILRYQAQMENYYGVGREAEAYFPAGELS